MWSCVDEETERADHKCQMRGHDSLDPNTLNWCVVSGSSPTGGSRQSLITSCSDPPDAGCVAADVAADWSDGYT